MGKYIPLDAVLAEIKRRYKLVDKYETNEFCAVASRYELVHIKNFINTLEVKEVDLEHLEQEVKDFCYRFDDRKESWYNMTPQDKKIMVSPTWSNFAMQLAKHFFELGVNASNPIAEENLESFY